MSSHKELESNTLFSVRDLTAVVTGGGTGIGLMAAQTLAANGARVYIVGRREEPLHKVAEKYSGNGEIIALPGDISNQDDINALVSELQKREAKGLNILVNNAGVASEQKAKEETSNVDFSDTEAVSKWMVRDGAEAWRIAYEGNVIAHHFLTAALLPLLKKGRDNTPGHSSSVINISSVSGLTKSHSQGQFAYSSSKAAITHLTKEWANTFIPLRIRVNCIAPGLFPSEMTTGSSDENQKSQIHNAGDQFPAGRTGSDADIGSAILYLGSRAGSYLNGQVLHVDGGLVLTAPSTV